MPGLDPGIQKGPAAWIAFSKSGDDERTEYERYIAPSDAVDFSGPAGVVFVRQAFASHTVPFEGGNVVFAVENPQSIVVGAPVGAAQASVVGDNDDAVPDFVG